ncbi:MULTISPECIES: hypothetical protein [unclassified Exiguobacterium]|nr:MULTISPECIES: hypothetical protein [unclassified Exiguobacterium]
MIPFASFFGKLSDTKTARTGLFPDSGQRDQLRHVLLQEYIEQGLKRFSSNRLDRKRIARHREKLEDALWWAE